MLLRSTGVVQDVPVLLVADALQQDRDVLHYDCVATVLELALGICRIASSAPITVARTGTLSPTTEGRQTGGPRRFSAVMSSD